MTAEITTFNYEQLEAPIADFLRTKERNMREIVGKAYTELGRELKEAQELLSNNRNGVFKEWCGYIGMAHKQVIRLIQRYDMVTLCHDNQELLEDLPVTLSYEIAAPSSEATEPKRRAKSAVLEGEVKTLKEYREVVAKLEAAEALAEQVACNFRHDIAPLLCTPNIYTPMRLGHLKRGETEGLTHRIRTLYYSS